MSLSTSPAEETTSHAITVTPPETPIIATHPSPPTPTIESHALPRARILEEVRRTTRHEWRDPSFGLTVHSDFPPETTQPELETSLRDAIRSGVEVFPNVDPSRLHLFIFDRVPPDIDGIKLTGLQHGHNIYVFAGSTTTDGLFDRTALANVRHELVHAFIELAKWDLPRWMEEGLAQTLSNVRLDSKGEYHAWIDETFAEYASQLLRDGKTAPIDRFLQYVDGYPAAVDMGSFYVQAWGLTLHAILHAEGSLSARVDAFRHASRGEWIAWDAAWRELGGCDGVIPFYRDVARLDDRELSLQVASAMTSRSVDDDWWSVFDQLAASHQSRVRVETAELLARPDQSERWWQAVAPLLDDGDLDVGRAARRALWRNAHPHAEVIAHITTLTSASNPEMRAAAWFTLLINGDIDAATPFFRETRSQPDRAATFHSLTTLRTLFPSYAAHPDITRLLDNRVDVDTYCGELSRWIDERRQSFSYDTDSRRYLVSL